ncbi:helix-turn-helix transcriptional regulator [Cohnella zeiphila]|uniref:AraC family transcriptional regulator n=1 Tax=Cohnella zeiphila TaxID=2761120 RepID=A0A7X0SLE5_9BACL|nr:AraC family transcriptional regulator [Cohnella zeiphila]MBB6729888.1 AraC family transcriptional regulator [Cohnella zeiphila]
MKIIALPSIDADQFPCFPEMAGWVKDEPQHAAVRVPGEFQHFNLHVVLKGKGFVYVDGRRFELQAGDAFLFGPHQEQRYGSSPDDPWDVYFVHFYGTKIKEYLAEKGFLRTSLWTLKSTGRLRDAFEALVAEGESSQAWRPALFSALAYAIVVEFAAQAAPLAPRKEGGSAAAILELLPLMQERACEPFELREWAGRAGVSTFYFCKLFRKVMQSSPMEFVALCRIRQAKTMLIENRDLPLADIAEACGYPSVSYFIQRFKKQEGLTPREYRRNV